jgi:integrase/recombinase XerC
VNQLLIHSPLVVLPPLVAAGERAWMRFFEFLAVNIRNPHTRRTYARAADEFLAWCADAGVPSIAVVQPVHVATWIEAGTRELAASSVKQRLAAIRHLFDTTSSNPALTRLSAIGPGAPEEKVRFAPDSPLEGDGFEPSVPR